MPYSYASRDTLKARLQDTVTTDDAIYRSVLEAVTLAVDHETGHRFQPHMATRYQTPYSGLLLPLDMGLLAVTTLKTDADGNGVYETTWAASDYTLMPLNAVPDERPYTKIQTAPAGTHAFPLFTASVEIIGKWGYWQDLELMAATLNEALDASETGVDVSSGTAFKALDTIIIESEQMYVTAIATNTLTVERGVNGTTAATHDTGKAINRYRYPAPVVEALLIQSVRIFKRKDTPFGIVGGADMSAPMNIPTIDPDVKRLLGPYSRLVARYA